MKKLVMMAAMMTLGLVATGCSVPSCAKGNCRVIKPKREGCNDWYCQNIGRKLVDPRVQKGEEVTFDDGIVIRTYPQDKIVKQFSEDAAK
ncbi:hypothetical protein AGMMS49959_11220 [Planctomycetales bacterium]|nr:hypothetical protein AGMMS49959_11220 [Planctomycetales bacterium]